MASYHHTVQLVIFEALKFHGLGNYDNFVGLYFCGLGSYDNFVGLHFCGMPTLIT